MDKMVPDMMVHNTNNLIKADVSGETEKETRQVLASLFRGQRVFCHLRLGDL